MSSSQDLTFDLGTHWRIRVTCHDDPSGFVPLNVAGATIKMRIGTTTETLVELDTTSGISISNAAAGIVDIVVDPAHQANLKPVKYNYVVRVTTSDGTVSDQAKGTITLSKTQFDIPLGS